MDYLSRDLRIGDSVHSIHRDTADVATVLLTVCAGMDTVSRAELRHTWHAAFTELRRQRGLSPAPAPGRSRNRKRNGVAAHALHTAVARLEKIGVVRRIGEKSDQTVVIQNRERLRAIVELWAASDKENQRLRGAQTGAHRARQ